MNETDEYILNSIKSWVWSGFYNVDEVNEMIDDILEEDADEEMLRIAVRVEFANKQEAEKAWPEETDCDRLNAVFEALNADGIIALQNAGYTMSDGMADVSEVFHTRGPEGIEGYCYYHGQDLERAVAGEGLWLAFGDVNDEPEQKAGIGAKIKSVFEERGFQVEWNGDPEQRLKIPQFDWKRRSVR